VQIQQIPISEIIEDAYPRDRSHLAPDTLGALAASIRVSGLRQPIELSQTTSNSYSLISGFCRLRAYKQLAQFSDQYARIPAMIREPDSAATALLLMVEENAIRSEVAPWDQGRIAVLARNDGTFPTLDAAVDALYQNLSCQKRAKLRAIAGITESLDGLFTDPQSLSQSQCLRLAAAIRGGYEDLLVQALESRRSKSPVAQWDAAQNILRDAETYLEPEFPRLGLPRRKANVRQSLSVHRELTAEGWTLKFTGRSATGALMEDIMDEVERLFGRKVGEANT
jgi:ParB family chromosome partitioning protein